MSIGHTNYYAVFVIMAFLTTLPITNSYAQEFTTIKENELKNNPLADMILKNIEIANQRLEQAQEAERERIAHQQFIAEQRRIAQAELERDLASMNKKYEEFTPRNTFSKFVSSFNSTYHGIYWDQFEYMDTKVQQAKHARNQVLSNGGSYHDAMKQYVKHATISRTEMIKTVSDLNIQHGFSNAELQSYFDENGKLPRYENDDYTPQCFGCKKYERIKADILEESSSKINVSKINHEMDIQKLNHDLEQLKRKFLDIDDLKQQKQIINKMNQIVEKLQKLQEQDKTL